jgi:hypothetical protein
MRQGVLRRDRLRIVPDELVVDLLYTQTLFCRYVGIRERLRCLMGRFDFYPRFCPRTDGLRTREHGRKEQNEERGGSPLALLRPRLLIIIAVALPGETTFTLLSAGNETFSPSKSASVPKSPELADGARCRACDFLRVKQALYH